METGVLDDVVLGWLREHYPRYHEAAYIFMLSALHRVLQRLDRPRHITGRELAEGARDLALEDYGPMARTVLEHWGIRSTDDFGGVVFALVECGVLVKEESDSPDDFQEVFDFAEVFDQNYPWGSAL